jgi:PAS domain S-box-containing protein
MVIVDQEGSIVLLNDSAARLFGYSRVELLGKRVDVLLPQRYGFQQLLEVETVGPRDAPVELHGLHRDGTEIPIEVHRRGMQSDQGPLVASAIRDVSERRAYEQALHAGDRSKGQFLARLSSDLRTPLTGIIGFSELLSDRQTGELTARQRDYLSDIVASGQELLRVMDQIIEQSDAPSLAAAPR